MPRDPIARSRRCVGRAPARRTAAPTRRELLRWAGSGALAAGLGLALPMGRARAKTPTLRIAQWTHFVPAFDDWFDKTFAQQWGERNGVRVVVDHISMGELRARAATEVAAQQGHDLFGFLDPPPSYESQTVPVTDIVTDCERRLGRVATVAHRGTFNPRTHQYYAFSDFWAPAPLQYRTDWWGEVGMKPDTWQDIREGARRIRERVGGMAGFGLAPEPDSNMVLRSLLWSYGATEQDEGGRVTINSPATIEAVKLMTTIYRDSMTPDVFMWDPSSNNRFFIWGKGSIIQNAISAIRSAEVENPEVAKRAALAPPAAGPRQRLGADNVLHCYVIWKFAESPDLAKRFLVDLVASYDDAFRASEFYNLPSFMKSVHNLRQKLLADRHSPGRYLLLADAEQWSACPGYPGYATPATEAVLHRSVIPFMFARVARGEQSAEESVRQAEAEMKQIFARWAK